MSKKYSSSNNNKPDKQRALVLQGGGALGAYEVGVIHGLYEKLTQEDKENGLKDSNNSKRSLFDIVAGTSIGAMNGAVLVSQFLKAKEEKIKREGKKDDSLRDCWETAINDLKRFWTEGIALKVGTTSNENIPPLEMFPMFSWWRLWNRDLASEEAARRYYSTKEFVFKGTEVFSMRDVRDDDKFGDPDAKGVLLNDEPLQNLIEQKFGKFPIGTRFDRGEPRLLVTAVDIAEGITVTFDSYKKSDGKRKTVYYSGGKYGHKKEESRSKDKDNSKQIVIEYENGITIKHVMASGTLPELYDPKEICEDSKDEICKRKFWDGGLLSNTPLRELLEAHRDYWVNVENKDEAPDLEVYIVNVHPSRIDVDNIPKHYDEVKDRNNDILYGDRTYNDQYAASLVTDYIDFIEDLKHLALNHINEDDDKRKFEEEYEKLKTKEAKSTSNTVCEHRKYEDLIRGRFELKVKRIERKYDPNISTSQKGGDITPKTIHEMIERGKEDAALI